MRLMGLAQKPPMIARRASDALGVSHRGGEQGVINGGRE